jgi:hypothetical protein
VKKKPDRKLVAVIGLVVGAACAAAGPPPASLATKVLESNAAPTLGALEKKFQPGAP